MSSPAPSTGDRPVRRPRHLMDPSNPRPPAPRGKGMSLSTVQKWVLSSLVFTTIMHLAVGVLIAAFYIGDDRPSAEIGLTVIAALFSVLATAAARAIHRVSPLSPWLLVGPVLIVTAYFLFR